MADVLVVGAGISGLAAAGALQEAGHDVVVVDKGRRPGGRMATRQVGEATFDHGAQFLTAQSQKFIAEVERWVAVGVGATWFHGGPDAGSRAASGATGDAHPRYRGAPSMRAIPERLALDLAVRCGVRARRLAHTEGRWVVLDDAGAHLAADAVVLTAPAPQALELLADVDPGGAVAEGLRSITYEPCWAVLVRPDGTPDLPEHGARRLADHPLHFIADNQRKGVSGVPAVTLHASAERTQELLEHPGDLAGAAILADAAPWVRGTVVHTHLWRHASPMGPGPAEALVTSVPGPLAIAGDGLVGGRVEGAWTSGRAAATELLSVL